MSTLNFHHSAYSRKLDYFDFNTYKSAAVRNDHITSALNKHFIAYFTCFIILCRIYNYVLYYFIIFRDHYSIKLFIATTNYALTNFYLQFLKNSLFVGNEFFTFFSKDIFKYLISDLIL